MKKNKCFEEWQKYTTLSGFFFLIFKLSNKITPFESFRLGEKELVKSESKKVIIVTNDVQKDNSK